MSSLVVDSLPCYHPPAAVHGNERSEIARELDRLVPFETGVDTHTLEILCTELNAVPHAGLRDPNPEKPGEGDQSSCS